MSKSTTRTRVLRAGFASGAAATVLLGLFATPAYAAVNVVVTPATGPNGGGNTVTLVGSGLFTSTMTAPVAAFNPGASCPATPAGTGNIAATVTKGAGTAATTTANVVVPAGVVAVGGVTTPYKVCVYGSSAATVVQNNNAPYSVSVAAGTASPTSGPSGGGNIVNVTSATEYIPASVTTPGATFSTAACPQTYTTTGSNFASSVVARTSATAAAVTVPATVTTLSAPTDFNVCVYNGTAGSSVLLGQAAAYSVALPTVAVSPTSGASGAGNTINITGPFLAGIATPYVRFSTSACVDDYGVPGAGTAAIVTKADAPATTGTIVVPTAVLANTSAPTSYNVCFYAGNGATDDLIANGGTYSVSLPAAALSAAIVGSADEDSLTLSSNTAILSGVPTPFAVINSGACSPTYVAANSTTSFAGVVRRLTNFRLAITMPASVTDANGGVDGAYNVCVYSNNTGTSKLVAAPATFRAVVAPTLAVTPIAPGGGPALGGTPITITGANFPATGAITATLGGVALQNIVRVGPTSLTAVTPPHAAEDNLTLVVNTINGTATRTNAFDYSYGIIISPTTGDNDTPAGIDVAVQGVGFEALDFSDTTGTASTDPGAHVYLMDGVYTGADLVDNGSGANTPDGSKDNPPLAECIDVLVITDTELICRLELADRSLTAAGVASTTPVPDGAYTLTVVNKGDVNPSGLSTSNISSGSTFTVSDY